MGRMFRIITEGPIEAVTAGAALAHAHDGETFVNGDAPYIEVGGASPVFHSPKPTAPIAKPRDYLSVALHQVTPKPKVHSAPSLAADLVAFHHPEHKVSAEYRDLAAELRRQVCVSSGPKAVHFAATGRDRGTTTVILNLAITLAKETDERVLVVDADFDHAQAAKKLGLSDEPGLAEVLSQSTPLAWAIQPTAVTNLQLLGTGKSIFEATLPELPRVLTQLRQWFDWILIDGGTWGDKPQRDAISPNCDALYMVTRHGETVTPAIRQQIARHGGLLRGYVTTQL